MAKKWPEKVIQRSFIKEHSFVNRLYVNIFFSRAISRPLKPGNHPGKGDTTLNKKS
jgi:hypothetical protein